MTGLINLFITTGPSILLIAALIFYGKNLIEYFFREVTEVKKLELNQEFEKYRQRIENENKDYQHGLNEKLEGHKNKLELLKQEYQIQFSHLHQERALVIKELYIKLIELQSAMYNFTRKVQPIFEDAEREEKERLDRVNKALKDFNNFYASNKIYLPKSICTKLNNILKEYWDMGFDFEYTQRLFKDRSIPKEQYREAIDKQWKISDRIKDEFPPVIEEIEDEFKLILGVKE